jgi:hypothetical protein
MSFFVTAGRVLEGTLSLGHLRRGFGAAPSVTTHLAPPIMPNALLLRQGSVYLPVTAGCVFEGTLSLGQLRRGSGAAPSVTRRRSILYHTDTTCAACLVSICH